MRLIGISMKKINLLYIIQNSIIGIVSTILAFGASRLCLLFMSDYVQSMGVVLNYGKIYGLEFVILVAVFVITVLLNKPMKENVIVKKMNEFITKIVNYINSFEINVSNQSVTNTNVVNPTQEVTSNQNINV